MKKLITTLLIFGLLFVNSDMLLSGNYHPEQFILAQHTHNQKSSSLGNGYSKDRWTVFYKGRKVEGAVSSSFQNLGDGYGKDSWTVFYRGQKVEGASPSSFEFK